MGTPTQLVGLAPAMTVTQLFNAVAIRIIGEKAWEERFAINWALSDIGEHLFMEVSNGALIHYPTAATATPT